MYTKSHYLMMLFGILAGMSFLVFIAVQIALARIDMSDPATWPNMGPQMAYFGIPMFTTFVAVPSVLINLLLDLAKKKRLRRPMPWFALGAAYSLLGASYPMVVAGMDWIISIVVGGLAAIAAALVVRQAWGDQVKDVVA